MRAEKKNIGKKGMGLIAAMFFIATLVHAQDDLIRVKSLSGTWKFSIGEREEWIMPQYDDSGWEGIRVPGPWEDQGFHGYNGFATYRRSFTLDPQHRNKVLYLVLGYVDDVDETFINGKKIGMSGGFPPRYETAYNAKRIYLIPSDLLHFDKPNIITVKVYDAQLAGGIISGDVGIYSSRFDMQFDIGLSGTWKFRIGDDMQWKERNYDDSKWNEIFVPGKWEDQGYRDYDGFAWYRRSFYFKGSFNDEKVVIVLGRIDDFDEVYVNGVLVGNTGEMTTWGNRNTGNYYREFRGYYVPAELLKPGEKNTIAVRVYDSWGGGGIYEGPAGILSQRKYIQFWRSRKNSF